MLGARDGQDGDPGLASTIQFHGKLPWKLGLSVPICKMNGWNRNSVSHRGAWGTAVGRREPPAQFGLLLEIMPW